MEGNPDVDDGVGVVVDVGVDTEVDTGINVDISVPSGVAVRVGVSVTLRIPSGSGQAGRTSIPPSSRTVVKRIIGSRTFIVPCYISVRCRSISGVGRVEQ